MKNFDHLLQLTTTTPKDRALGDTAAFREEFWEAHYQVQQAYDQILRLTISLFPEQVRKSLDVDDFFLLGGLIDQTDLISVDSGN